MNNFGCKVKLEIGGQSDVIHVKSISGMRKSLAHGYVFQDGIVVQNE